MLTLEIENNFIEEQFKTKFNYDKLKFIKKIEEFLKIESLNETQEIKENILNAMNEVQLIKEKKLPKKTLGELLKEKRDV